MPRLRVWAGWLTPGLRKVLPSHEHGQTARREVGARVPRDLPGPSHPGFQKLFTAP